MQTTINIPATFAGVGLHSGEPCSVTIRSAGADHGIVFRRMDVSADQQDLPATWDKVKQSPLCTCLQNDAGITVSTIEHIMAALCGCGVHNALIEVSGPEVPILDGSSAKFVQGILAAGVLPLDAPIKAFRVLKPVEVRRGDALARLLPNDTLTIEFKIEFEDSAIGAQSKVLNMANGSFIRELSTSRTFCRQADVDAMQANGLALGGSSGENAVVFDGNRVVSPGGLRQPDEPVRHKMLDALGDLALAGLPILGYYQGERAGHALTNDLLRALFADPEAFEVVTCDAAMAARLPGAGVHWGKSRRLRDFTSLVKRKCAKDVLHRKIIC
nr:UDP-3-O-acyl-N-acetylglucosamine deacetylase [Roseovarius sp. W115]MDV2931396.1 UDP-3-O-acyl-N-acetylglucosamine deacetylase [Roseovarius sp. W115]